MDSHVTCQTALSCVLMQVAKEMCGAFLWTQQALTWQLLNQCSTYLLDQWLTCNRGNNVMLLAGRVGCQHVQAAQWLSGRPSEYIPDFSLLLLHISRRQCLSQSFAQGSCAACWRRLAEPQECCVVQKEDTPPHPVGKECSLGTCFI